VGFRSDWTACLTIVNGGSIRNRDGYLSVRVDDGVGRDMMGFGDRVALAAQSSALDVLLPPRT
jgi:hypothetical protein